MKEETIVFNMNISKKMHTRLKMVAALKGVTMTSIINNAIRKELKEIELKEGISVNL